MKTLLISAALALAIVAALGALASGVVPPAPAAQAPATAPAVDVQPEMEQLYLKNIRPRTLPIGDAALLSQGYEACTANGGHMDYTLEYLKAQYAAGEVETFRFNHLKKVLQEAAGTLC